MTSWGMDRLVHSVAPYTLGTLMPIARRAGWRYGDAPLVKSVDYASRILVAVVLAVIAAPALHDTARAQELVNAPRPYERSLSGDGRVVPISRTPEGFTLGASKADISYLIRTRWGLDYAALNVVWDPYWYSGSGRTISGRFTRRRCGGTALAQICEGTILRSATASMIEILTFQDRVFRISITLPEVPDYGIQSLNMMQTLRDKYGPPLRGSRWHDGETELVFSHIGPAWPARLHYTDIRGGQEVENAARAFVAAEHARMRARSLQTPRGY